MNQGLGLRLLALALVVVGCCCAALAETAARNIVLIVAADHGRGALGCCENKAVTKPHFNALAADGTRCTEAFCTTASCRPSRSVILTGPPNHRNGIDGFQHHPPHFPPLDPVNNLQVLLAEAGYRTAQIGKFHFGPAAVSAFQTVRPAGAANDPATIGRSPVEMAEPSRSLIEAHDARPFFFFLATDDPHRANAVLPEGNPPCETCPKSNRWGNRPQGYPGRTPVEFRAEDVSVAAYLPDSPASRSELAEYYQAIARLDQGVGRLIALLKSAGKYDAPHGLYFRQRRAVFRLEDHARQARHASAVHRADPGPGVRGCGAKSDGHAGGSAADLPQWVWDRGADGGLRRTVFSRRTRRRETDGMGRGVRLALVPRGAMDYPLRMVSTREFKLIPNLASGLPFPAVNDLVHSPTWMSAKESGDGRFGRRPMERFLRGSEFELYDLARDPDEVVNLAEWPGHQRVKREPIAQMKAFQQATKDPWFHQ